MEEADQRLRIDTAFPGGNVILEKIEGDDIHLHQDRRDTEGWWFYWAFRLRGGAGRRLQIHFTDGEPVGTRGPAISTDGGWTWRWTDEPFTRNGFQLTVPAGAADVRLAFSMVYTEVHWAAFMARIAASPLVKAGVLTRSRNGRAVEMVQVGRPHRRTPFGIFMASRHHCCEMMATYALEGVIEEALSETDEGSWLRRNASLLVVPFVDKDGVEEGDQGKNRRPHDHNRDYAVSGPSLYPEIAAIRKLVPRWARGRVCAGLDMHCPWIRGKNNESIYQVGKEDPAFWAEQQRFGAILERVQSSGLEYRTADDLPFGVSWNVSTSYSAGMSCSRWLTTVPQMRLASSFELPYANAAEAVVNQETARAFGHDVARALVSYFRSIPEGRA